MPIQQKGYKLMANAVLSPDQIREIQSKARTKGAGEEVLQAFLDRAKDSGEDQYGEVVDLTAGALGGKSPESAAATLGNAKRKTRDEAGNPVLVNPQFRDITVKKVGKGEDAIVALIYNAA